MSLLSRIAALLPNLCPWFGRPKDPSSDEEEFFEAKETTEEEFETPEAPAESSTSKETEEAAGEDVVETIETPTDQAFPFRGINGIPPFFYSTSGSEEDLPPAPVRGAGAKNSQKEAPQKKDYSFLVPPSEHRPQPRVTGLWPWVLVPVVVSVVVKATAGLIIKKFKDRKDRK